MPLDLSNIPVRDGGTMKERIDLRVDECELDNRDLGETWIHTEQYVISITIELALLIVANAIENAKE